MRNGGWRTAGSSAACVAAWEDGMGCHPYGLIDGGGIEFNVSAYLHKG